VQDLELSELNRKSLMMPTASTLKSPFSPRMETETDKSKVLILKNLIEVLICLAILAGLTSFLFFLRFQYFYTPDSSSYEIPAAHLSNGQGFTNSVGYPETDRTPGYPLLISVFILVHTNLKYVIIFQHTLRLLIVLGTAVFSFVVTGNQRVAMITGIVLCLDLPLLESANAVMTEIFFTALFGLMCWLLWIESGRIKRPGIYGLATGLFSGASALIRPVSLFFFLPASLYLSLSRPSFKLRSALIFTLTFLCLPSMWAARNYYETGYFTVSSISGTTMLLYRAAGALAVNDPGEFSENVEQRQKQLQSRVCNDLRVLHAKDCSQMTIPEKSEHYSLLGRKIILMHPFAYAKVVIRGDAEMIFGGGLNRLKEMTGIGTRSAMIIVLIYSSALFCFAMTGLIALWKKNRKLFAFILFIILYFVLVSGGAEAYSRFRVPIMPLYALSAAVGLDSSLKWLMERQRDWSTNH
jgi:hypothetical protein